MSTAADLADRLLAAHRGGARVATRAERAIVDVDEAYGLQARVLDALSGGNRAMAWKVSPARPGSPPLLSPVPPEGLHRTPARLAIGGRSILGVEVELAFCFRAAPPADGKSAADMAESIGEALVLIELCATRLADWSEASALWKLADFQSHGAFVLGTGTADWRSLDYTRQEATLEVNGSLAARSAAGHPNGDPTVLLPWAAAHCSRRGTPLAAGDVVTLGSWTGITPISAGDEALAVFPGIGEARLALER